MNEGVPETHCNKNVNSDEFETIFNREGQMLQGKSQDKPETNCKGDESSDMNLFQPEDIENICN